MKARSKITEARRQIKHVSAQRHKTIAAPINTSPMAPIGLKESAAPLKGVVVGEGAVVGFAEAVPVLKVFGVVKDVSTLVIVEPTAEGEYVFSGLTRTVVVVDSLAVVEADAVE